MLKIGLVGCGKKKAVVRNNEMIPACDLYVGDLFKKRRELMESRGLSWYILSAKSGAITPSTPLRSYDERLKSNATSLDVAEWHLCVANQLMTHLYYDHSVSDLTAVAIELHAGKHYCEPLATILQTVGISVLWPVFGMGIGQQLKFYSEELASLKK